jgi:hypothetical protein
VDTKHVSVSGCPNDSRTLHVEQRALNVSF